MNKIMNSDRRAGATIELIALELLYSSETPVGNQSLVAALREADIVVAEATAGRVLHKLVSKGFARTLGKRGRVLTPAGRTKLLSLRSDRLHYQRTVRLVEASSIEGVEQLHEMLLVRRAIEPEAAKLAALRATKNDLELLDQFSCAQCMASIDAGQRVDPAISFHSQLLKASHHALLIEIGLLILEQTNTRLLDQIAYDPAIKQLSRENIEKDAQELASDHEQITDAIRSRDPERAEKIMRAHIDHLLAQTTVHISTIARAAKVDPDGVATGS